MNKPFVILHMLISIDGKITGDFLSTKSGELLCEEYYRINREYKADAYCCGRVTMEGSFTHSKKPNLTPFTGIANDFTDYVAKNHRLYAVAIDPHGRLGYDESEIIDYDPGYDDAHIIEILTEDIPDGYTAYLRDKGISYLVCGKDKITVDVMLEKLNKHFKIEKLLLEGGGLTDTLFLQANAIDELSLVVCPNLGGALGIDLFSKRSVCDLTEFSLEKVEKLPENGLWLNYKKSK